MKKLTILLLSLGILFSLCGENSTGNGNEEEDIVTIKLVLTKEGDPVSNALVKLDVEQKAIVNDPLNTGPATGTVTEVETEEGHTKPSGVATFVLKNATTADTKQVVVRHVYVYHSQFGIMVDEDVEIIVKRGETKEINYNL